MCVCVNIALTSCDMSLSSCSSLAIMWSKYLNSVTNLKSIFSNLNVGKVDITSFRLTLGGNTMHTVLAILHNISILDARLASESIKYCKALRDGASITTSSKVKCHFFIGLFSMCQIFFRCMWHVHVLFISCSSVVYEVSIWLCLCGYVCWAVLCMWQSVAITKVSLETNITIIGKLSGFVKNLNSHLQPHFTAYLLTY